MPMNDHTPKNDAICADTQDHDRLPHADLGEACRNILSRQGTAISIRDSQLRPLYINPAYEQLFGITHDEWLEHDVASHLGPKAAKVILDEALPKVREMGHWEGELEVRTFQGVLKHVIIEMNSVCDPDGMVTHFFGTYFDVTRLKALEKSMHLQVDFLNNIIDTVPDPIFVKDEQHNWVVTNQAHCDFMGRDREEVIGKTDYDFFVKEEADVFWKKDNEVFTSGEENINEENLTDKDGVTHMISTKKATFTQDDGQRILVGVIRNITEERRLSKALASSYHQLQEAFIDLQDRLRGIQSHIASEVNRTEAIQDILNRSSEEFEQFSKQLGQKLTEKQPAPARLPQMSRREHQVFILIAQGLRIKNVAEQLGLSATTVSTYLSRLMKKLEVKT